MRKNTLSRLTVRRKPGDPSRGWLSAGRHSIPIALPVALGRGGIKANKREGDGATPRGTFRLRRLWWRADRHPRPATLLPVHRIKADDGWCEDPADRHYNRPVKVPADSKADRLARTDHLYDFHYRARPQHAAPHRRSRQRGIHSRRAARFCADRRLRRA